MVDGPPHDPPQHVLAPGLLGKDAVRDQERRRARVVGHGAQRHACRPCSREASNGFSDRFDRVIDERPQEIGLVVRAHALQHRAEPFQPHPGVDGGLRQRAAVARRHLVELHEHQVPDLDPAVAVAGRPQALAAGSLVGAGDVGALEVVNLAARAARPGFAHRPEVVLVAQRDDPVVADAGHLLPDDARFGVGLVHRVDEALGVDAVRAGQQLVRERDRVRLEVVAEAEVAQHLEERVVARGAADVLEVVVLAAGAHALLRRRRARRGRLGPAGEVVLELVHPRVREQQRRVVVRHQRGAGDLRVPVLLEEVQKGASGVGRQKRGDHRGA